MKILFLVNGGPQSAAAERAAAFSKRLPSDWTGQIAHRPPRKWQGIVPFIRRALQLRPDVIYVMDTAYTGVIAGRIAKSLTRCALISDTGDAAFELARSSGNYSARQLALIRGVEQMALHHADAVVVRGSFHRELLLQQGIQRVEWIPDGVDLNGVRPVESASFRAMHGLKDFVVGMVGTMSWSQQHQMCYGWDVVEALAHLRDVPIQALLVGDGDGKAILQARAQTLGVAERVVFAGRLEGAALLPALCAMDACVSTQSNDVVGMVRTTGKLPLYLALNRYVMATDVGEAKNVLPGIGCLLPYRGVRDDEHPGRLAEQLRLLMAEPERLTSAQQGRDVAARCFDYDVLAARVTTLCQEMADIRKKSR